MWRGRLIALAGLLMLAALSALAAPAPAVSCAVMQPRLSALNAVRTSSVGPKKLIFYRVRFPDDTEDPVSLREADDTLAEVNAIYTRMSGGRFSLIWTISPVLSFEKGRDAYSGPGGFDQFLSDARAGGALAGFDYSQYDLDIVRHTGVPGFMGGNANLGIRGAQVQAAGAVLIVHELGHNLGLNHANAWVTGSVGVAAGSPPLPSNFPGQPDPRSIPVYPDSFLGHESIIGPGYSAEYGDAFDIMGSGTVEFNAIYRAQLGWLEEIATAGPGLTSLAIQTSVGPNPAGTRAARVTIPLNTPLSEREYWIELPPADTNRLTPAGVLVRWADSTALHGGSQLLSPNAANPNSPDAMFLAAGRTFSDFLNDVHVSVGKVTGEGDEKTADLVVFVGDSRSNHNPILELTAAASTANPGETISLAAQATDPDGDELLWHWDFGDGTTSTAPNSATKSWDSPGDFLVRLEVTDRKGGSARSSLPIRIGSAKTARISGRVLTSGGTPVAGARVHNGISDAGTREHREAFTYTDSDGSYTLTGLVPGRYPAGAFLFGYAIARRDPVTLADADISGVDFVATQIPRVSVAAPPAVAEDASLTNLFTFTRTGDLSEPLTVPYRLSGTATPGQDYVRPFFNNVTFPAGSRVAVLALNLLDDPRIEPNETIRLDITYPSQGARRDASGNLYTVYFPGWDLALIEGQTNWVQTDPSYLPGAGAFAVVTLQDNDALLAKLSVTVAGNAQLQITAVGATTGNLVLERSEYLAHWTPLLTNAVKNGELTLFKIPLNSRDGFFRTRQ